MAQNKIDAAVDLLREQIGSSRPTCKACARWPASTSFASNGREAADVLRAYLGYAPEDAAARIRLIDAELRAGGVEPAASATLAAIGKEDVDNLLAPWLARRQAGPDRRPAVSTGPEPPTSAAGSPWRASSPSTDRARPRARARGRAQATLPVKAANVIPNAIYGGRAGPGRPGAGRRSSGSTRCSQLDGTNREALRARAMLRSRTGNHKGAIEDAQKLVAADQDSARGRAAARPNLWRGGRFRQHASGRLWDGFHQVGDNRAIFDALRPLVAKSDGPQAAERLSQEFYDKR